MRIRFLALFLLVSQASGVGADDESAQEKRFISNARQLVFEGNRSGEGYFSPDGKKLIFQSEREPNNPFYQQYILNLETGETIRVSPGKEHKGDVDFCRRNPTPCLMPCLTTY